MAFERLGQFVEKLDELGCCLIGEIGGQAQQGQVVRLQHDGYFDLRMVGVRALVLRSARSFASLRR